MGNRFSNDEAGKMTVEQQLELLTRMLRLLEELQTEHAKFIGKDEVDNYLRWSVKHLAEDIWGRVVIKDYGINGDA
jgi:hypothetical protein